MSTLPRHSLRALAGLVAVLAVLSSCKGDRTDRTRAPRVAGDPLHGEEVILARGCGACHTIPGIRGARGLVAPPLTAFAERTYIAGELPNTPDNLVRWIVDPRAVHPRTAMPVLGLDAREARDVAAYLYTLE